MQPTNIITPGLYVSGSAKLLRGNQSAYLFQGQSFLGPSGAVPCSTIAVELERIKSLFYPWGFSLHGSFNGAPGAFQIDFQVSDIDSDLEYVSIGSTTQVNANNRWRIEGVNFWAQFARARVVSLTNTSVLATILATR